MTHTQLIPFDSDRWRNKEMSHAKSIKIDPTKLVIVSGEKTDWWRTAKESASESDANRTSGPVRYIEISESEKYWKAGVWISGVFDERFKQATLFLGTGDYSNQGGWLKAGVEVEDDRHNIGCVAAVPFSDWCICPIDEQVGSKMGEKKLYMQFARQGADIHVHYALHDDITESPPAKLQLLREIKGFAVNAERAGAEKGSTWHLGVMVCGPGSEQTEGEWHNFYYELGARAQH